MLSSNASEKIHNTKSTSFSCDLLKWLQIMQTYESGRHAYHATMPTDAIKDFRVINWSSIPPGKDLNVRMSGLVWPEAAQRIANSAYLTRERIGKGQIILFAGEPNFRGSTRGTNRLWLNALIYGAGLGASSKINL